MGCIYTILSTACLWLQRSSHIGKRWNYCSQIIIPQNPYAAHYGSGYNSHPVRHIRLHIRLHKLEISSVVKQYFLWSSKLKTILTKLTYLLCTIYIFSHAILFYFWRMNESCFLFSLWLSSMIYTRISAIALLWANQNPEMCASITLHRIDYITFLIGLKDTCFFPANTGVPKNYSEVLGRAVVLSRSTDKCIKR